MVYRQYLESLIDNKISKKYKAIAKHRVKRLFKNADQIHSEYGLNSINELL
jgi:hypothetical protein